MDIPALSMALAQNNIKNDYGVAMLAKSLDNLEANGAAMVSAMNSMPSPSLDPNVGQNIDISIWGHQNRAVLHKKRPAERISGSFWLYKGI